MAIAIHSGVCGPCGARTPHVPSGVGAKLMTWARRLNRGLGAERSAEVDRKIAGILAQSGGPLTDSLEREIMRKVFASDWSLPQ
jgi:hypothetical protein